MDDKDMHVPTMEAMLESYRKFAMPNSGTLDWFQSWINTVKEKQVVPAGRFKTGDPNDGWQCYVAEGNEFMETMFQNLAKKLRAGELTRQTLIVEYTAWENENYDFMSNMGALDSEPQCELVERLNVVLEELGWKSLAYGDL